MKRLSLCAAATSIALVATSAGFAAEPIKIRADWSVLPGQFAALIPTVPQYGPDVYRDYGKSYTVEPIKLTGGGATLTALAVGGTDVSTFSPQTLIDAVVNAKLDVRAIGEQISTEVPGYAQTYYWVDKEKIKTFDDLKGKVFAVNALGSNVDAAAKMVMAKHGMTPPRDYSVVEVAFPAQLAALKAGKINVAVLVPPFDQGAQADPGLKPMFSVGDAFGPVETLMWVAKEDFIKAHREALVDFLADNIRMRRWMLDPKTRMDAVKQLADASKIPIDKLEGWAYTNKDYFYPPNAGIDVQRLQKNVNDMAQVGVVPKAIDVTPYVDMSLVKDAEAKVAAGK
ncbi:MAG TPA: ABC transporter substrate-binding protein [Stellaceae bacterium]|nr:ABC transporter substrate-binding protein [Stellaceae bacterium]